MKIGPATPALLQLLIVMTYCNDLISIDTRRVDKILIKRSDICFKKPKIESDGGEGLDLVETNSVDGRDVNHRPMLKKSSNNFKNRKLIYKIENMPACSDLTAEQVKTMIDSAAEAWNSVPYANILLENVDKHRNIDEETNDVVNNADELDTIENTNNDIFDVDPNLDNVNNIGGTGRNSIESNDVRTDENSFDNNFHNDFESENDNIDNNVEPENNNIENNVEPENNNIDNNVEPENTNIDNNVEPENNNIDNNVEPENNNIDNNVEPENNNTDNNSDAAAHIDVRISFVLCKHSSLWGDPTSPSEEFLRCPSTYGHAKKFGEIHFNTLMTWSDKTEGTVLPGEPLKPNLYTLALHEFGHTLGLDHTTNKEDVMFKVFGGTREYRKLKLTENDMSLLQNIHDNVRLSCKDNNAYCSAKDSCDPFSDKRNSCKRTCRLCSDCDEDFELVDEYLKCSSEEICKDPASKMLPFCRKTCNLCQKQCRALPVGIPGLVTREQLPVLSGTQVAVQCEEGMKLVGDAALVCEEGTRWRGNGQLPKCTRKTEDPGGIDVCEDVWKNCLVKLSNPRKNKNNKKKLTCKKWKARKNCRLTCDLC